MSVVLFPELTSLQKIYILNLSLGNTQRRLGSTGTWKKVELTFPWNSFGSFWNVLARFLQNFPFFATELRSFKFLLEISEKKESCKFPARNLRRIIQGFLLIMHSCLIMSVPYNTFRKFIPQRTLLSFRKPLISSKSKFMKKFSLERKFWSLQSSKFYVKTYKLRKNFLLIRMSFWFKTYQGLQDIRGNVMNVNFAGKHFLSGSKMDKTANLSQKCPKMAFCNFCNSNRNDCKLDKILRNCYQGLFWKSQWFLCYWNLRFVLWCFYF